MCHREANRFPFIAIDSSLLAGQLKIAATHLELEKQPLPKLDDSIIELYKGVGKLLNKYTAGKNALEPHMSKETLEYHWGKHHRGYVDNLNKQIVGTELDGLTSEGVVLVSYNTGDILPAFNNAAQTWNYEFFWESMAPGGGGKPSGDLLKLINRDLGPSKLLLKNSSWQHLLSLVLVGPGLHRFAAFMAPLVSGRLTGGSGAMYSAKLHLYSAL